MILSEIKNKIKMNIQELLQKPSDQLSTEELEKVIEHRKKTEKAKLEKERKDYEDEKDADLAKFQKLAQEISEKQAEFKNLCHERFEFHQKKLNNYGKIKSNSKGGFHMLSSDLTVKGKRRRDTTPTWDERSLKGLELIHAFLYDTVKKRDKVMFEMLIAFLIKNQKGDLDYPSVMNLLKFENEFKDERWLEGCRLLKEGYSTYFKGYQYDIEVLDDKSGKYKRIELNFSAI